LHENFFLIISMVMLKACTLCNPKGGGGEREGLPLHYAEAYRVGYAGVTQGRERGQKSPLINQVN
jgi:hypothetical protein